MRMRAFDAWHDAAIASGFPIVPARHGRRRDRPPRALRQADVLGPGTVALLERPRLRPDRAGRSPSGTVSSPASPSPSPTVRSSRSRRCAARRLRRVVADHRRTPRPPLAGQARRERLRVACAIVSLAERLGYGPDAKLLIVNCDDLGSSRSANVAIYEALRDGLATSATLMVPCPWARDAAAMYRGEDVGVHLTLNAEWDTYRWGPITHSPSLLDGDGGFPRTVEDVWDHADLDEVRKECRAQLERAIYWGFDVSHLDSHMGTMQLRPEFFDVYLELAVDFQLPLRMAGASARAPDRLPVPAPRRGGRHRLPRSLRLHERRLAAHDREGAVRTAARRHRGVPASRASTPTSCGRRIPTGPNRVEDHAFLTSDPSFRDLIDRAGVTLDRLPGVARAATRVSMTLRSERGTLAALCDGGDARGTADRRRARRTSASATNDEVFGDERGAAVAADATLRQARRARG